MTQQLSPPKPVLEIDRQSEVPVHQQVENWLREQIKLGIFRPGDRIPGRKEFSVLVNGVNHLTINKAVMTLTREGLLYSTAGLGTFVSKPEKKQFRIALLVPSIDSAHARALVRGVQGFCAMEPFEDEVVSSSDQKMGVVLFDSRRDAGQQIENIKHLEDLPLDGAIVVPLAFADMVESLVRLKAAKFPLVLLDEIPGISFNTVGLEDYESAYRMTKHLLARGRKRIAWVTCRKAYFSGNARYEGYHHAICDSGLPVDRSLECELEMSTPVAPFQPALERVIERLFAAGAATVPDAIICGNDLEATATIKLLQKRGLSVPNDVAVAGFGGHEVDESFTPGLTTAVIPAEKMGRAAARLLLQLLTHPDQPVQHIKFPLPLLVRESA